MDKRGITDEAYENILIYLEHIYDVDIDSIEKFKKPENLSEVTMHAVIHAAIFEAISDCYRNTCDMESDIAKKIERSLKIEFGIEKAKVI